MEEIKENEFVRTDEGYIAKYIGTTGRYMVFDSKIRDISNTVYDEENFLWNDEIGDIVKHSKNIIDLIEIGDYVNGYSIDNIINGVLVHRANGIDRSGYLIPIIQYENDIKTIVTKEQFASLEYKI